MGKITDFIRTHYRHFNAAVVVDAAEAYRRHLDAGGKMLVTLAGAASYLAFAIPVPNVAGLGPPQAAWVAALNLAGVGWETAIVTALTAHAVLLVGPVMLGLATFALRGPAPPWPSGRRHGAARG